MLASKLVELEVVDSISPETVRKTLKIASRLWLKQQWRLPKKQGRQFVWRMEDVLETCRRSYDPQFPGICMDEASKGERGSLRFTRRRLP